MRPEASLDRAFKREQAQTAVYQTAVSRTTNNNLATVDVTQPSNDNGYAAVGRRCLPTTLLLLAALCICGQSLAATQNNAASQGEFNGTQQPAPRVDYANTQLLQLESLDDLLPKNLFQIEIILFERLLTNAENVALAKPVAQSDSPARLTLADNREPLLLDAPRILPADAFTLSPATLIGEVFNAQKPIAPASAPLCLAPSTPAISPTDLATDSQQPFELLAEPSSGETLGIGVTAKDRPSGQAINALEALLEALNEGFAMPALASKSTFQAVPKNQTELVKTPYLTLLNGVSQFSAQLAHNPFRQQPREAFTLGAAAARLQRTGELNILQHMAWQQRVPTRDQPQPIYIHADNGKVRGHIDITLGRYLHTAATLWLQPASTTESSTPDAYALLNQSRRMRSGELHYLDHPLFGLLVRIEKVSYPEELQAKLTELQANSES